VRPGVRITTGVRGSLTLGALACGVCATGHIGIKVRQQTDTPPGRAQATAIGTPPTSCPFSPYRGFT